MRSQLQVFTYEDVDPENKGLLKHRNKRWPAGIYLFRVNDGNTRTMCEICSKLTIKTRQ